MGYDRGADGLRTDGSKGHVLIADDAPFSAKRIECLLAEDGYTVVARARNGEEAFSLYQSLYPDVDLVTLDVTMPKQDGMTTLKQLIAFDKDVHVVMITSSTSANVEHQALEIGAKQFITKPLSQPDVLERIHAATRN